jgi:hypothetical protein
VLLVHAYFHYLLLVKTFHIQYSYFAAVDHLMTITAVAKGQSHSKMAKQKNHKKHTKKGYDGSELQQSCAPNSPSRNLPRRRRRNMNLLSADDYKLRQEVERGTSS